MLIGFEIIGSAFYSFLTKPVSSFPLDCNLILVFHVFPPFFCSQFSLSRALRLRSCYFLGFYRIKGSRFSASIINCFLRAVEFSISLNCFQI